jgi:hypothetical protein
VTHAPRPRALHPTAPLRRALPALCYLGMAARLVVALTLLGALSLVWARAADVEGVR